MSERGSEDETYKPTKNDVRKTIKQKSDRPARSTRKNYLNVDIVSDPEEQEGLVSVDRMHRSERLSSPALLVKSENPQAQSVLSYHCWTPRTLGEKIEQLGSLIYELAVHTTGARIAKKQESNITALMQMMVEMKAEDGRAEQRRIDREEDRLREDE